MEDVIKLGTKKLLSLDPFKELDPMMTETEDIARSTIEELEIQWKMMKILIKKKMTVHGLINLHNWMGEMLLASLMRRCKSNCDDILYCFILLTFIFL